MPDGKRHVWARADVRALAPAGLRVLAGAPEATIVAAADQRFRRDAAWYAAFAAVLFLSVWWMADRGHPPAIARMTGMAGRLARWRPAGPRGRAAATRRAGHRWLRR
jgi:hypothetical protein